VKKKKKVKGDNTPSITDWIIALCGVVMAIIALLEYFTG
jgi:hypothetical protein